MIRMQTWQVDEVNEFLRGLVGVAFDLVEKKQHEYRKVYDDTILDVITKYLIEHNSDNYFQLLRNYPDQTKGNVIKAMLKSKYRYGSLSWIKEIIQEALGIEILTLEYVTSVVINPKNYGEGYAGKWLVLTLEIKNPIDKKTYLLSALNTGELKNLDAVKEIAQSKIGIDEGVVSNMVGEFVRNFLLEVMPPDVHIEVRITYVNPDETGDTISGT